MPCIYLVDLIGSIKTNGCIIIDNNELIHIIMSGKHTSPLKRMKCRKTSSRKTCCRFFFHINSWLFFLENIDEVANANQCIVMNGKKAKDKLKSIESIDYYRKTLTNYC